MTLSLVERLLTEEEVAILRRRRPPFIFWRIRRLANEEIARGVGEELNFEIVRVWNANPCEPPCCPPHLLFQLSGEEYVSVTFQEYPDEKPMADIPRRGFTIVRSPLTRIIVWWRTTGERVPIEPGDLGWSRKMSRGSLLPPASSITSECEVLHLREFSDALKKVLGAT
jgi:hypothetical protein